MSFFGKTVCTVLLIAFAFGANWVLRDVFEGHGWLAFISVGVAIVLGSYLFARAAEAFERSRR